MFFFRGKPELCAHAGRDYDRVGRVADVAAGGRVDAAGDDLLAEAYHQRVAG